MDIDKKIMELLKLHDVKPEELKDWLIENKYNFLIINNEEVILIDKNNKEVLT